MIQKQLSQRMISPIEGNLVYAIIHKFIKWQVQVFQAWFHVTKHKARDALYLVADEHKVQQRLG